MTGGVVHIFSGYGSVLILPSVVDDGGDNGVEFMKLYSNSFFFFKFNPTRKDNFTEMNGIWDHICMWVR